MIGSAICCVLLGVVTIRADESAPAAGSHAAATAAAAKTGHTVAKGPFEIVLNLDGVFEAREREEIKLDPDSWSELVVREVAGQGTAVKAGDKLLRLDSKKLDDAISDLEAAQKISDLTLRQAEADLGLLEKTSAFDLLAAEQAKRAADEDLRHFLEKDRDLKTRTAEFNVKQSEERLEYAQAELSQLEKMYRSGDLREETEEIILKRQRNSVESAKFFLEQTKALREQTINAALPREEEKLREVAQRSATAMEKLQHASPIGITKARLELEKLRTESERSSQKLEKLRHDQALMTVVSPRSGVVYYGAYRLGQWATAATVAAKLIPGGALQPHEVLITVVNPQSIEIRAVVPEGDLHHLKDGLKGAVTPAAYPAARIAATLAEIPKYPDVSGKYPVRLAIDAERLAKLERCPVPGMSCNVKLLIYKADALTVPTRAVFTDPAADSAEFVFVESSGGKPERREIKIGQRAADRVEITGGLKAGETVLFERPEGM
jgi:multidrug efflux pump subunit AcrA (membrane-fusion protein)